MRRKNGKERFSVSGAGKSFGKTYSITGPKGTAHVSASPYHMGYYNVSGPREDDSVQGMEEAKKRARAMVGLALKNPYNIRGFKSAGRKGPELFNFGPFLTSKAAGIEAKSRLRQHFLSMGDATETIKDVREGKGRKLVGFRAPSASAWISPVRKNVGRRRNPGLDEDAIRELVMFIENDGDLYRMQMTPIIENLAKKKAKGQYDVEKAVKLWGYLVENGARKYAFEFGTKKPGTRRWMEQGLDGNGMFPKPERIAVARELERNNREFVDERAAELAAKKKKNPYGRRR
jgi:hypothetical protein